MNALELRGLTKHYKDFTLGPLDLTLPGGTICGLIGENGAGKSTTIKLILDMLQKDGGTVTILGRDSRTDLVHTKEEIGVVLGSDGIPQCLNAVEVGKVMAGIYRNWDAGDYTAFCRKFDLPPDKKYKDYSAGMQRKLCIAVALSHHGKVRLLGDATNGLDPGVRDEVVDILLDFARDEERSILIPPTSSATWKSCAIPSPSCTRAGCCSVRKRTPCERNTPCGTARRRSWRHWMYGCTASGSPPTESKRLCAGTQCPPGQSLPR